MHFIAFSRYAINTSNTFKTCLGENSASWTERHSETGPHARAWIRLQKQMQPLHRTRLWGTHLLSHGAGLQLLLLLAWHGNGHTLQSMKADCWPECWVGRCLRCCDIYGSPRAGPRTRDYNINGTQSPPSLLWWAHSTSMGEKRMCTYAWFLIFSSCLSQTTFSAHRRNKGSLSYSVSLDVEGFFTLSTAR